MEKSTETHTRHDQGFILIVVLWGIGLLVVLAATFNSTVRVHTRITANAIIIGEAEAAADGGVHLGVMQLVDITSGDDGSALGIPVNGSAHYCRMSETVIVRLTIEDEGGKVDLNAASTQLLEALFAAFGGEAGDARTLAQAVLDYRDADDARRPDGAETPQYVDAGRSYGPANRNFLATEELEQVLGITQALYKAVRPYITVHSKRSGIDPTAASPALLGALTGAPPDARGGVTQDIEALRASFELPAELAAASAARAFLIRSKAHHRSGGLFIREAIVDLTPRRDRPFKFATWRQGVRRSTSGIEVTAGWRWNDLERLAQVPC